MPHNSEGKPCGNGGHEVNLKPKQIIWSNLNLLTLFLNKNRQTIKNYFSKNKLSLSDYQNVCDYLKKSYKGYKTIQEKI